MKINSSAIHRLLVLLFVLQWNAGLTFAASDLKRGDPAPPLTLRTIVGNPVQTDEWKGRICLYIFGDSGQEKTKWVCRDLSMMLDTESAQFPEEEIRWLFILSKSSHFRELIPVNLPGRKPDFICPDPERRAFGAYGITVMPTVVIVDREGRLVHLHAGYSSRLGDIVHDALLLASGKLSVQDFEHSLHGTREVNTRTPDQIRADRLSRLADQLARKNMKDAAATKFREALDLDPDSRRAHLGLGNLLLDRKEYAAAKERFHLVLSRHPESLPAALGLGLVLVRGTDADLDESEILARRVLERSPKQAKGHYLQGLIHESRGNLKDAASSYRKAAELLLNRHGVD